MKYRPYIKTTLFLAAAISCQWLCAQDIYSPDINPDENYRVEWVSQFPPEDGPGSTGFKEVVSNLIFGQKPELSSKPFAVLAESPDAFLVLDQGLRTVISQIDGEGEIFRPFRSGNQDYPSLVGICSTAGNELLFTDSRMNKIYRIKGNDITVFNESLNLQQPTGIAYLPLKDEIWVVETASHCLSVLNRNGEVVKKIGSRGTGEGEFNFPTFIWIDKSGNIYIVDSMNFRIQIFDEKGNFISAFGEAGDATGYLARPKGIATDSKGHIYVADALFHTVQVFDRSGNLLYYFGNQGQGKGEFWIPSGLFIDKNDFIYVADSYNSRVQVFQLVKN